MQCLRRPSRTGLPTEKQLRRLGASSGSLNTLRKQFQYPSIRRGYRSSFPKLVSGNGAPYEYEYEYESLFDRGPKSKPIRLLELLPGEGSQPLRIELNRRNLDGNISYEALSYAWGDPRRTQQLQCGERILPITQSVYEALNTLRLPDLARTLWIDAVCINQSDIEERNTQVRLMHHIYAKAACVVVWLGLEDEESKETMCYIRAAGELEQGNAAVKMQIIADRFSTPSVTINRRLKRLARRSWFSRAWVIQEFCVANNPVIRVGALTVSVKELSAAFDMLTDLEPFSDVASQPFDICDTRHEFQQHGALDAFYLVDLNRDRNCDDPRDRIYSMLGIFPSDVAKRIMPDYGDSLEKVYINFAKLSLQGHEDSRIFGTSVPSEHSADPGSVGLPTWVPDWREQWTYQGLVTFDDGRRLFNPSGKSEKWLQWMENDRILCLKASGVDTIAAVCEYQFPFYAETETDNVSTRSVILREWASFCLSECRVQCSNIDANDIFEALWRSVVIDLTHNGTDFVTPGDEHRLDAFHTLAELNEQQAIDGFSDISVLETEPPCRDGGNPLWWSSQGWDFINTAAAWCAGRRLFVTANGMIGHGPPGVQENDHVCIFRGGLVPSQWSTICVQRCVLRPWNNARRSSARG